MIVVERLKKHICTRFSRLSVEATNGFSVDGILCSRSVFVFTCIEPIIYLFSGTAIIIVYWKSCVVGYFSL